jgi:hypothetical protein
MKTKVHRFVINAGEESEQGKPHWPDFLRLHVPRDQALTLAMDILRRLENPRSIEHPTFEIPLFGEMVRLEHEDLDSHKN